MSEEHSTPVDFRVAQVTHVLHDYGLATSAVVLREVEGARREISIPVALPDATTIYQAWHHLVGRRPTSNELMALVLQEVHADVIASRIVRIDAGIYFAELDLMTTRGRRVFDCRPSDAIAVALRQPVPAPLLIAEDVLALD